MSVATQQWDRLGERIDRPRPPLRRRRWRVVCDGHSGRWEARQICPELAPPWRPRPTAFTSREDIAAPAAGSNQQCKTQASRTPQLSAFNVSIQCAHTQTRPLTTCYCCQNTTQPLSHVFYIFPSLRERRRARFTTRNTLSAKHNVTTCQSA